MFQTKQLVKGLEIASQAVHKSNSIPILGAVRVNSSGDMACLTASDTDVQIDVRFPGKVKFDGGAIANPASLASVLKKIGGDIAKITMNDKKEIALESGGLDMEVVSYPVEDFPDNLNGIDTTWTAEVGTSFLEALKRVRGAVSTEETRYYLNGIFIKPGDDKWGYDLVATDGHRLYTKAIQIAADNKKALTPSIMPRRFIELALKIFDGKIGENPLRVSFGQRKIINDPAQNMAAGDATRVQITGMVGDHEVTITSKLVDGSFPDYKRVVPKGDMLKVKWSYEAADLRRAMAALCAHNPGFHTSSVATKFSMKDGTTTLTANFHDFGRMRVKVPHEGEPPNFEIGFNSRYVLGAINAFKDAKKIMVMGCDAVSPVMMVGDADPDHHIVLMPMRV